MHTPEKNEDLIAAARPPPGAPTSVQSARHNKTPSIRLNPQTRGRLHHKQQEHLPSGTPNDSESRWKAYTEASAYPAISAEGGKIVTAEWLAQNGPDYSRPWLAGASNGDPEKDPAGLFKFRSKRRAWYVRAQRTILRNPIIPLVIRMNVWVYSAIALGLATSIYESNTNKPIPNETPSTDMAIIVDAVAMIYLLYITYDEYSGKPLGLRPANAKMRLIFLDLFFIVWRCCISYPYTMVSL